MAFTVEDGTGLAGANSFASVAEFDDYCAGHLYATAETARPDADKEQALMMASRIIDAAVLWKGVKKTTEQGLGWPRQYAIEQEVPFYGYRGYSTWGGSYQYFDANSVPKGVKDATCEMARELMKSDRTAEPEEQGVKSASAGPVSVTFDAADRPTLFPQMVKLLLRPFGRLLTARSRYVDVVRV